MKPLVIYRANNLDGATAALAAWLKFGDEAEYRPARLSSLTPAPDEVRGRNVYVLGLSYPRAPLLQMESVIHDEDGYGGSGNKLLVLDNRKAAQAKLISLPFCVFDTRKSVSVMAWEHFHQRPNTISGTGAGITIRQWPDAPLPELFRYVQDSVFQRWELLHSREIDAALRASGASIDFKKLISIYQTWDHAKRNWPGGPTTKEGLVTDGGAILRAEHLMIEHIVATAEKVEIVIPARRCFANHICDKCKDSKGMHVRALATASPMLQSEVGKALALESAHRGRDAVGIVYYHHGTSGKWRVSLRSQEIYHMDDHIKPDPALDVSVIAKHFGGDGDITAAEFECDDLPWMRR